MSINLFLLIFNFLNKTLFKQRFFIWALRWTQTKSSALSQFSVFFFLTTNFIFYTHCYSCSWSVSVPNFTRFAPVPLRLSPLNNNNHYIHIQNTKTIFYHKRHMLALQHSISALYSSNNCCCTTIIRVPC